MKPAKHQYIERTTGEVRTEQLYQDQALLFIYHEVREKIPAMLRLLTGARASKILGYINYDSFIGAQAGRNFLRANRVDLDECLDDPNGFDTLRKLFERRIKYWDRRPLPADGCPVVSPADARVLVGSFAESSRLLLKEKFFAYDELLARDKREWLAAFAGGDFAIFRLTPDKYHYNHVPAAGVVVDRYDIDGCFHSCNPGAVVREVTPYSKNRRVVTIIDTDVTGGAGVGLVAMIEVVALMIGDIVQCYSESAYDAPRDVMPGLFLRQGQPKSVFRPGSSTTVLMFQRERVRFAPDLLKNQTRADAHSRFSAPFGCALIETDVAVRSAIAYRHNKGEET